MSVNKCSLYSTDPKETLCMKSCECLYVFRPTSIFFTDRNSTIENFDLLPICSNVAR